MSRQCVLNSYVRILFINNRMQIYSFFMKGGVFRSVFDIKNIGKQTRRNLSCRVPQSLFVSRRRKKTVHCVTLNLSQFQPEIEKAEHDLSTSR